MLRLTLLAPDIVGAILDGRQGEDVTLDTVMAGAPVVWREQRGLLTVCDLRIG
jgi:hypothetical protein